jgi:glycosyltransferase involved in cell wall biosynthesis
LEPKVSIVTPLYNSSVYIQSTLGSVLAQTLENWELILVNDGSQDDTTEKVKPYLADPRISYISQDNQGIAGARNTGIAAARGEWVCLLDHDDRWLPNKLEKQLEFAATYNLEIVSTDAFVVKGAERHLYSTNFPKETVVALAHSLRDDDVDIFKLLIEGNFLCSSSVAIKRQLFERLGLLDPKAAPADDYEMWLRCSAHAKIGYLDEPLIEYHMHEGNYSRDTLFMLEKEIYALTKSRAGAAGAKQVELLENRIANLRGRAARMSLDTYHELAGQSVSQALPFLWRAFRIAPAEVLRPGRLLAAARKAVRAEPKGGHGASK